MGKLDRSHVSEIDQVLSRFDQEHPEKSESQQAEIAKHNKIFKARDEVIKPVENKSKLWEGF